MLVLPIPVQAFAMLSEATQVVQPLVATAAPVQTAGVAAPAMPHSSSIGGNTPAAKPRCDVLQVCKLPLLFTMSPRMRSLCTWHLYPDKQSSCGGALPCKDIGTQATCPWHIGIRGDGGSEAAAATGAPAAQQQLRCMSAAANAHRAAVWRQV
jgi:putative hemolysin